LTLNMTEQILIGKRIAILIAFKGFKDEEYFVTKEVLAKAGGQITTFSDTVGVATGDDGGEAPIDELLNRLIIDDYEAIVFVGGAGMARKIEEPDLQKIARQTTQAGKILAAICCAPAILAKAGVLKDRKATVWSSILDKSLIKILKSEGADYQNQPVVIDDKIVTADGPDNAQEFGEAIIDAIRLKG